VKICHFAIEKKVPTLSSELFEKFPKKLGQFEGKSYEIVKFLDDLGRFLSSLKLSCLPN
jgi:hypothetical protein